MSEKIKVPINNEQTLAALCENMEKLNNGEITIEKAHLIGRSLGTQTTCLEFDIKRIKKANRSGEEISFPNDGSQSQYFYDPELQKIYLSFGEIYAKIANDEVSIADAKKILKELNKQLADYRKSL
jgi:hypothetical protein